MRPTRPGAVREAAAKLTAEEDVRVVIEMPPTVRRTLRMRAAARDMTIRDYVIGLIQSDADAPP